MTGAGGSVTGPRRESLRIRVLPIVHESAVGPIPSRSTRGGLQVQAPIPARRMTRFSALLIAAIFLPGAQVVHAQTELSLTGGVSLSAENGDAPVNGEFEFRCDKDVRRPKRQPFRSRVGGSGSSLADATPRRVGGVATGWIVISTPSMSSSWLWQEPRCRMTVTGCRSTCSPGPALALQVGCRFDVDHFDRGDALNCDQA